MQHLLCDTNLRQRMVANLGRFKPHFDSTPGLRRAAVTLTLVDAARGSGIFGIRHRPDISARAALILTRRAPGLNRHSGQWALPGGRLDAGETPEQAALRELHEEVGLDLDEASILGRLDDFTTRSGFVMSPVVVWGGCDVELTAEPREVASIHRIPVEEFLREDAPILQAIPESDRPVLMMPIGLRTIAAPTGAILYQFREVALQGRETRVRHYEQPTFAWR